MATVNPRAADARAATRPMITKEIIVLLCSAAAAGGVSQTGQVTEEEIEGSLTSEIDDPGFGIEDLQFSFNYIVQRGRGFQSQASIGADGRGDQEMVVIQPMGYVRLRQNEDWVHELAFPVDLVTAASPDALDAISTASAVTEAGALDMTSTYLVDEVSNVSIRYGIHQEETTVSLFGGLGYTRSFADDNAILSVSALGNVDLFDWVTPRGFDEGVTSRGSYNANVSLSQILSPTTIGALSYGLTHQRGTLQVTWNSVPVEGTGGEVRVAELFPDSRTRHAIAARIAQHIPWTDSTLKGNYRFYTDSFDLDAHTFEVQAYQYITRHAYIRAGYRHHRQTGVSFFTESVPSLLPRNSLIPRTADSDLERLNANEYSAKLVFLLNPKGSAKAGSEFFDLSATRYIRDNDLSINVVGMSYGGTF